MPALDDLENWLEAQLPELAILAGVPGAAVAIQYGERTISCYTGHHDTNGRAVDQESIFEIGSITKVWTATLVMQLVEEGLLSLEAPISSVLPEFRITADNGTEMTVRHLLTHTAGFDGDLFIDTGDDADSLAQYVAVAGSIAPFARPGAIFSYCNAGFCVLGRLVEVMRAAPFDQVLLDNLIGPLGLTRTFPDPRHATPANLVIGHAMPDGAPVPVAAMARGMAPTGTRLSMTARDLCAFGFMHAAAGRRGRGDGVLGPASIAAMQLAQGVSMPDLDSKMGTDRGLGWAIHGESATAVLGHNGHTLGQVAALRILPEQQLSVAIMTNGGSSYRLIAEVVSRVQAVVLGRSPVAVSVPEGSGEEPDAHPYVGTYRGRMVEWRVESDQGGLVLTATESGAASASSTMRLRHLRGHSFVSLEPDCGEYPIFAFVMGADGRADFLHNGRAFRRERR